MALNYLLVAELVVTKLLVAELVALNYLLVAELVADLLVAELMTDVIL